MRCALVYYSLTGHVKFLVQQVRKSLDCDVFELQAKRPYPDKGFMKFYRGGRDASLRWKVALQEPLPLLDAYQVVVVCTPVWAGRVSSPIYSYLSKVDLRNKQLYFLASSSGGDTRKCFISMEKLVDSSSVKGTCSFIDPAEGGWHEEQMKQLALFCTQIEDHLHEK